jgi:hypothetical protein
VKRWFYASDQWHVVEESLGVCGAVVPTNYILLARPNLRLYTTPTEFLDHFCEECHDVWLRAGERPFWEWEINFQKRRPR